MILAKIILTSSLIVMSILFSSIVSDASLIIKEAKSIEKSFTIISELKNHIASMYKVEMHSINKQELITHLPKNTQENISLLNEEGNFNINKNEKLKVLILKKQVKSYTTASSITPNQNAYTFYNKNTQNNHRKNEEKIKEAIEQTIALIYYNLALNQNDYTQLIQIQTPYSYIYQEKNEAEKRSFFKQRLQKNILIASNFKNTKVFQAIKGFQ